MRVYASPLFGRYRPVPKILLADLSPQELTELVLYEDPWQVVI